MNIAVVSVHGCPCIPPGGLDAGGMNVYVRDTATHLGELGNSVVVFSRHHKGGTCVESHFGKNVVIVHVPVGDVNLSKGEIAQTLPKFVEWVLNWSAKRGARHELVAAHYWFSGLVGISLAKAWDVPLAFSYHTMASTKIAARDGEAEPEERLAAEQQIATEADRIVVWTDEESARLVCTYRVPAARIKVSAPGVDCTRFAPIDRNEARSLMGLPDTPTLLFVGRLDSFKGVDLLLDAFAKVVEVRPSARLLVAGDGDTQQRAEFGESVARLGLQDSVRRLGQVSHDLMPVLYSSADVMMAPSFHETYGLATLEAAACGVPAVVADVDGLRAIVMHGETGYLVKSRDPKGYARFAIEMLSDDDTRRRMGDACRNRAEKRSWRTVACELAETYREIVSSD